MTIPPPHTRVPGKTRAATAAPAAAASHPAARLARRTQAERRSTAEERLITAACGLMARKGWPGTTLAEVGEAAGYSRGLAAHHFGNKAGLLRALTLHIKNSFLAEMQAAPARKPGLDALLGYFDVYLRRADPAWTNTRTLLLLMAEGLLEGSETGPVAASFNKEMFDYLERNVRTGIENGEIRPDASPAFVANLVIGSLRGLMLQGLVEKGDAPFSVTAMRKQFSVFIRNALAPSADKPGASRPRRPPAASRLRG